MATHFTPAQIIAKKRDGKPLTSEEIQWFIRGLTSGDVADYQATAFLMATYLKGMSRSETVALTEAMRDSGKRYQLDQVPGAKVDKHSTGGVGDKVTLLLAPLAAACGLVVPSMAGRGLGHTGGTVDKLEAIPGFRTGLTELEFKKQLRETGCAIIAQTKDVAPADKKLYSLRDVTATVDCIPLIVGSILSKKLAEGSDALLLDVKVGNGALMKTPAQGKKLAEALVSVAKGAGLNCRAVLTAMDRPLGYSIGNASEVMECVEILRGVPPAFENAQSDDLRELTLQLCARMLVMGKKVKGIKEGYSLAVKTLESGDAWKKFQEMVAAQGGDASWLLKPHLSVLSPLQIEVRAKKTGWIQNHATQALGEALIDLGGGRKKASDRLEMGAALIVFKKVGEKVKKGDLLLTAFTRPEQIKSMGISEDEFSNRLNSTFAIGPKRLKSLPLIVSESR